MAKEILKDEILSDAELDNVAGGTRIETFQDGDELYKRGDALSSAPVSNLLPKMGVYKDNGRIIDD